MRGPVAGRYAQALFDIASEEKVFDRIEAELKAVKDILDENVGLQRLLYHPQITAAAKKELLDQLFKGKISEVTGNFLALLVDRRRETYFNDIVEEFVALANASRGITEAKVTTAVELNDTEKGELSSIMARLTGKKVQTSYAVDPSIIGGVIVRMGDKIIDGSVKTRLSTMKDRLKAIS
jgi:F-type H+-transporting ATPase subunit delta